MAEDIKKGIVPGRFVRDNSITEEKLSEELRIKIENAGEGGGTTSHTLILQQDGKNEVSFDGSVSVTFNVTAENIGAQPKGNYVVNQSTSKDNISVNCNGYINVGSSSTSQTYIQGAILGMEAGEKAEMVSKGLIRLWAGEAINLESDSFTYNNSNVATEKTLESYLKKNDILSGDGVILGTNSILDWGYISPDEMGRYPVSVGNSNLLRRIMFLADGKLDWDAATVGQLKKKVGVVFSAYRQLSTSGTDIFTFDEGKIMRMWRGNPSNLADILYIGVRNNASSNSYNTVEYSQTYQSGSSGSAGSGTIGATTSTSAAFSTTIPSTNSYAEIMLFMSTSTARTTTSIYRITINCFSTAGLCWITIEKLS